MGNKMVYRGRKKMLLTKIVAKTAFIEKSYLESILAN